VNFIDAFFLVSFPAIFTIVNPLGALGPFLAMTAGDSVEKRKHTAARATWIAFAVLCACTAIGGFIFRFFGITMPALKIAGGLLLFSVAVDMINARESRTKGSEEERKEGFLKDDIAIFPLGIPLLSGPGSIVTVFILVDRAQTYWQHILIYFSIGITMSLAYFLLRQANQVEKWMGQTGINVFNRLMGISLAAIAVQFVIDGVGDALPGLKH
jgi:multiple antibiotic resistance protein